MSPANAGGKSSVDRSPLQAVSLTNMGANKTSPTKQTPHFQWVLLDDAPVQVKMCSVTLDLLHTCEFCDRDFASMERLMEHMSMCRSKGGDVAQQAKRMRFERACSQGTPTAPQTPAAEAPTKKSATKHRIDFDHQWKPKKKCFSPPNEPTAISKKHFMEGFGLVPMHRGSPKIKKSEGSKNKTWKLANKVLKMFPFTHLPKELHLRNFSFQPSPRVETINAEKIAQNWVRIDALAPAYPINHRRYLPFIPKGQTFKIVDVQSNHWLRNTRVNLTAKKSLTPTPPCLVKQKRTSLSGKGYRVKILQLSEADILRAEKGINLPSIIERYKGKVRKLDKTDIAINERGPVSIPPAVVLKTPTKTALVVSLERLPSNVVAISKNSPVKASCPSQVVARKSPRQLELSIALRGSPRRLLLSNPSASITDDDSEDEVVFLGCFSNIN